MLLQVVLALEALAAHLAGEAQLGALVRPLVDHQVVGLGEAALAVLADVLALGSHLSHPELSSTVLVLDLHYGEHGGGGCRAVGCRLSATGVSVATRARKSAALAAKLGPCELGLSTRSIARSRRTACVPASLFSRLWLSRVAGTSPDPWSETSKQATPSASDRRPDLTRAEGEKRGSGPRGTGALPVYAPPRGGGAARPLAGRNTSARRHRGYTPTPADPTIPRSRLLVLRNNPIISHNDRRGTLLRRDHDTTEPLACSVIFHKSLSFTKPIDVHRQTNGRSAQVNGSPPDLTDPTPATDVSISLGQHTTHTSIYCPLPGM